jgi:cytochrome c556
MAKGEQEFDAAAAGLAASNLAAISATYMPGAWLAGTDNESMDGTAALPALWEANPADVGARAKALSDAAVTLAGAAGTLEGLRGAIGPVGKACGGCHKPYRAKPK